MAKIFPIDFEEKNTIAQDDYILFSDSEDWNKIKKAQYSNLKWEKGDQWIQWPQGIQGIQWPQGEQWIQWPQGEQGIQWETWPQGEEWPEWPTWPTGNWIASITSSKVWKTTTVTITETNGNTDSFTVEDWADGQWSWDVIWPASSTDGHLAVFDGATWKLIKDGGAVPNPTTVVDSLDSSSTTSALSANQGKVLNDKISDLFWLWKFLSLWDATTGQPISFPLDTPYTYTTWDYFLVETVSTATPPVNYKPNGSSYTWAASSTTESEELEVWDIYIYDGTTWLLQLNHGKAVSFSEIAGNPSDNTALGNALNAKQDSLTLPATPTQWNLVTWGADNETLVDGWAIPTWFNPWGTATTGYVVTKTASGYEWKAPSWWDVMVSSQSWNILTSWMKIWAGTQSDYNGLWTYDNNTVYLTI